MLLKDVKVIGDMCYCNIPKKHAKKEEILKLFELYNIKGVSFGTSKKVFKLEDVQKW